MAKITKLEIIQKHVGGCRDEGDDGYKCWKPAEYVLWGKLFPPEALGPRCYDCAAKHAGHRALAPNSGYALISLRDLEKDLA